MQAVSDRLGSWFAALFASVAGSVSVALHLEILALRHQLLVVNRSRRPRVRLTTAEVCSSNYRGVYRYLPA